MANGADLDGSLRAELTQILRRIAVAGHIPDRGTRDVRIRINQDHSIAWIEPTVLKIPASELEHGFDETHPIDG